MLIRPVERKDGDPGLDRIFWCPACRCDHGVSTREPGPVWTITGPPESPTIDPSVKVSGYEMNAEGYAMIARGEKPPKGERYPGAEWCCHSVITAGQIHYELDCTHSMAGQTVPMVDF